jgi:hypothetical protein
MSVLCAPDDHPQDVLDKVGSVVAFLNGMLSNVHPEEGLELTPDEVTGLAYICQDIRNAVEQAGTRC